MKLKWLAIASLAGLCACGGGGGSNGGTGTGAGSTGGSWLTFSPASVQATTYPGEPAKSTITVSWTKTVTERLNVAIVDNAAVIDSKIDIASTSDSQGNLLKYDVTVRVSPRLGAGTYTGNLEVRLCLDDAAVCAKPYEGSPWRIPYNFTVKAGTDLRTLRALPGAASWTSYQGNAAHNGFVAADVNPANFTRRFGIAGANLSGRYGVGGSASGVAVEDGRIVFAHRATADGPWDLRAVSEATGQVLWSTAMGPLSRVNPPAISAGKVFVASTGSPVSAFWTFDLATGTKIAQSSTNSQWDEYLAPTVYGGKVYTHDGYNGGVSRYDVSTSAFEWFSDRDRIFATYVKLTTPTVDDQNVYMCGNQHLYVLDPATGRIRTSIQGGASGDCLLTLGAPGVVFKTSRDYEDRGVLSRFDVARGALAWFVDGKFQSPAVLVGDVVYVNNGRKFDARSAATGTLLWSWEAPAATTMDLVVVGQHAFVGTGQGTFAVDLRSRQSVWNYPVAGAMSVSANGVLYIRHPDGLAAINLQ